jgi:hypothetical protein
MNYNVIIEIAGQTFDLQYTSQRHQALNPEIINQVIDHIQNGLFKFDDVVVLLCDDNNEVLRKASIDNDWGKTLPQLELIRKACKTDGVVINFADILPITVK